MYNYIHTLVNITLLHMCFCFRTKMTFSFIHFSVLIALDPWTRAHYFLTPFPPSSNTTPSSIAHGWDFDIYEPPDTSGTIKRKSSSSSDSSFSSSEVSHYNSVQMDVERTD